jgi:type I restriction-modification system DNA methylase subunit
MGTGGFLTRLFNLGNINPENIYGCETELDTIKFGEMSLFLTTKGNKQNIVKCNSLSENPFMIDTKVDAIVTNPPFGTKMNYKSLKETYEKTFPDSTVKFEDVYPLKVNNGACLFVQHCVYMLNDGGVCAIVLPDGELFEGNSKWSKNYRKWLCENVNIHTILKCPGGTFDHATVTTNVVVFTKTGPTQNIRYIKTTKECEKINELITITKDDLEKTQYSLEVEDYIEEIIEEIKIPYIKLGDICELEKGEIQSSKRVEGKYKLVSQSNSRTHNEYKYDGKNVFVSGVARVGEIYYYDGKCHATTLLYNLKIKQDININPKYLYLVLKDNPKTYACEKGSSNKSLNQNRFMNIKIPYPDIDQQNEIVDHLNFVEIENRIIQMEKEKAQFVKYSRLPDIKRLLSDTNKLLITDIVDFEKGKVQSTKAEYNENGPYKFITKSESHKWQNITTYKYDGYNVFIANTCNGNGSIPIRKYEGKCDCSTLMSVIKPKININIKFIYYTLIHMNKEIEEKFTKGNGCYAGKLNIDKLKIPVPSPEIQEQCIQIYQEKEKFIQSIDDKIEAEKKYIEELKQLSKDIIHNYC